MGCPLQSPKGSAPLSHRQLQCSMQNPAPQNLEPSQEAAKCDCGQFAFWDSEAASPASGSKLLVTQKTQEAPYQASREEGDGSLREAE